VVKGVRTLVRYLALAAVCLATWEVAARLEDWWSDGASPFKPYSIDTLFQASQLGREGVPHARFGKWRMNGMGFRGEEPLADRERVLVFGASETFGQYESPGHEYPQVLSRELEVVAPGVYDVVNAALPGMRIGRMAYLDRALERTRPRFVVIYPSPANYIGTEEPFCHRPTAPVPSGASGGDHLRILGRLDQLAKRVVPPAAMTAFREADLWRTSRNIQVAQRVSEGTIRAFEADLECAVDRVLARGAVPVLVTHATYFGGELREVDRPTMMAWRRFYPELAESGFLDLEARANASVRNLASRRGLPLFDAAANIAPGAGSFADFVHFTDDGSRAMAHGLAAVIVSRAP
jgi:lysophospholipase L1-like esterase